MGLERSYRRTLCTLKSAICGASSNLASDPRGLELSITPSDSNQLLFALGTSLASTSRERLVVIGLPGISSVIRSGHALRRHSPDLARRKNHVERDA